MALFEDRNGQSWVVDINVTTLKHLRANDIDLQKGLSQKGDLIDRLLTDPIYLVDMIYVICKQQADERNVTDEDFGVALGTADAIESATKALIEGLKSFFPSQARVISLAMEKLKQVQEAMGEKAAEQMENLDVQELVSRFGNSLISALDQSGLTPDPSTSEN